MKVRTIDSRAREAGLTAGEVGSTRSAGASAAGKGLARLDSMKLSDRNARLYEEAVSRCHGSAAFRSRKAAELLSILKLCELAPSRRLTVLNCDLSEMMRVTLAMEVPVPCRDAGGEFTVRERAVLGLMYHQEALIRPLPGHAFVVILAPANVWHANVSLEIAGQPLCLGESLPVGPLCVEIILSSYGALSMQTVMTDEADPVGVMNIEAAKWWQQNTHLIPLSDTAFLEPSKRRERESAKERR